MSLFFRNKPVFAKVPFVYAGVKYEIGDVFEAPHHKIEQLWFARKLTHEGVSKVASPNVTLESAGKGFYHVLLTGAQMTMEPIKGKQAAKQWAVDNLGVTDDQIEG